MPHVSQIRGKPQETQRHIPKRQDNPSQEISGIRQKKTKHVKSACDILNNQGCGNSLSWTKEKACSKDSKKGFKLGNCEDAEVQDCIGDSAHAFLYI